MKTLLKWIKAFNLDHFIKGWSNFINSQIVFEDEENAKRVLDNIEACKKCKSGFCGVCLECGCPFVVKAFSDKECELGKWNKINNLPTFKNPPPPPPKRKPL